MPSIRLVSFLAPVCVAALAACSSTGTAGTQPPVVVATSAGSNTVVPASFGPPPRLSTAGAVRRTQAVPACSGTGPGSLLGVNANSNAADGSFAVVGGGVHDLVCDDYGTVVGGYYDQINSGSNSAQYSFIGGGYSNTIQSGFADTIAGGVSNTADGVGATVSGGGYNSANGVETAIAGGDNNTTSADLDFIGGGQRNTTSLTYAVVGGGEYNTASGTGSYIGGGGYNTASGEGAIVDGGFNSTAAGTFATVPGGYVNSAAGTYSFAAGARASAAQAGTFVWSDGSNGDTMLTSSRAYQFLARASGGVTFWTNAAATVGATLAPGSGTWASASDRNLKTDVAPLDDAAVLAKVDALPISRWSYKSERGVRHVGPMAQDFYAAFKVGEDDKHITSIDEDGVALSAIKALHSTLHSTLRSERAASAKREQALQAQIDELRAEIASLRR